MRTTVIAACSLLLITVRAIAQSSCPTPGPPGQNFSGQNLTDRNFSQQDLTNANFTGATLDGAQFVGANLTCANFSKTSLKKSAKGKATFLNATLTRASYQESKLEGTDFRFATVTCTDFSNSDLTTAVFDSRPMIDRSQSCRTKFVNATMRIHQFPIPLWRHTDFTNTNFVDLTPTFSFKGLDLSNAILAGINLGGFDLTSSTLNGADFTSADLRGAKLDRAKARGVKMNDAKLSFASATDAQFFDPAQPDVKATFRGATAIAADFSAANLSAADLRGANFSASKFVNASLDGAVLQADDRLSATQIPAADFSGATLRDAHLNGVAFQNIRLPKATLGGTFLNTNFSEAVLTGATFEPHTVLRGVSFYKSALQNVEFAQTDLSGVDFTCSQLGGAKFSGASITTATFNSAVMPPSGDCCLQSDGKTFHCGIDPLTRVPYGPTSPPRLANGAVVTCPNGEPAPCTQWSIPRWQSRVCNRDGTLETIWTKPNCGGGDDGEVVDIPDAKFRECLQIALFGSAQGQRITRELAQTVPAISCSGRGIRDVTGLAAFKALRRLDLSNNEIREGTIYPELKNLEVLKLSGNKLTTLRLSTLQNLSYLDASHNQIAGTIIGWVAPTHLQYLDLSYNQLSGRLAVKIHTNLFYVDLSHNRLNSVDTLSDLTSLAYLYLQDNRLQTIGSLKELSGTLKYLSLGCNLEFNCASLELDGTPLLANSFCGKPVGACQ